MDMSDFVVIGENIHCTRIVKLGGLHTVELPGGHGVAFELAGADRVLPIPADWADRSPAFGEGKVKHIALAVYQATCGKGDDRRAGEDYLVYAAQRQIDAGSSFLDVNADEYSNDPKVQAETMSWLVQFISKRFDIPLSIDSSSVATLATGLAACRTDIGSPMVNSVSLDRAEAVDVIRQFDAEAVVSAAGREGMPSTLDERLSNFEEIIALLDKAGVALTKMHLDPLVFPISTDPMNGKDFLEVTAAARQRFSGARLTGGFSNVSFGMPQRKLLNMVFIHLCAEAGANSGIINPVSTPVDAIAAMDTESEPFRLAKAFLDGTDMYGMEFIAAHREGKLG